MFVKPPSPATSQVWATFQSAGCLRCHLTATECRSRWIPASIQNRAAIVILKEQTYVGWANVDHFKGMIKSPVLDCSERGPRERKRRWQGWRNKKKKQRKERKSAFKRQEKTTDRRTIFLSSLTSSFRSLCSHFSLYVSACCVDHSDFFPFFFPPDCRPKRFFFGTASKEGICMWLLLQDRWQ